MSLLDKIKNNSTIKNSAILSISKFFTQKDMIPTSIPMINVALSGKLNGGFTPGITMFAGPSKHFKTAFSLLMAKSYFNEMPIIITRPFNYTGIGQNENFIIPKIVSHFRSRKSEIVLGNLDTYREYNNVEWLANIYFYVGIVNCCI